MEEFVKYTEPVLEAAACHVDKACYKAKIKTEKDLSPVMPYVNAEARVISFDPEGPVIIFRLGRYKVALRPYELAVATVPDLIEGREAVSSAVNYLNALWERRGAITPDNRERKRPQAFDIYKLLPKTNCRACGEASCLAFATKLALAELDIDSCIPLNEDTEAKERITKLVEGG
ncbi:(Fe-S)-binding protein [Dissulfurimicrobium hydrothermale]|uniref:(Fe-S)-binding protein n=1 Tax=Dissulfurimicrobium hydrothermale TaxID=1750598 RepID=UPI001EDA3FE7|nr:(Fe-S)-binding protein [Dissulfurimicrobium hydrothermale]UKL13058.1 hypothetical protein LGS26_06040 [Dissulfurimicrobium hydrothermale]